MKHFTPVELQHLITTPLYRVALDFEKNGTEHRVASIDGKELILTRDFHANRVNLVVEKGIVTTAFFG